MTVAKFENDTDAKWIIGLVAFSLILVVGWLASVGGTKPEARSESGMTHEAK